MRSTGYLYSRSGPLQLCRISLTFPCTALLFIGITGCESMARQVQNSDDHPAGVTNASCTLHGVWRADADPERTRVLVRELSDREGETFWLLVDKYTGSEDVIEFEGAYGEFLQLQPVPDSEPLLPARLRSLTRLALISERGAVQLDVIGFAVQISEYGQEDLVVLLEASPETQGQAALAVAGSDCPGAGARLRSPEAVSMKGKGGPARLRNLRGRLIAATGSEYLKEAQSLTVDDSAWVWIPGRFPDGATALVAIGQHIEDVDYFSALFTVDTEDRIVNFVHPPARRIERFLVDHLVDVDGDGFHEALVTMEYYEGDFQYFVRWEGSEIIHWELSGQGI